MNSIYSGIEAIDLNDAIEVIHIVRPESREKVFDGHIKVVREDRDYLVIRWHPHMVEEFWFYKTRISAGCDRVFDIYNRMGQVNFDLVYQAYCFLKEKYKLPIYEKNSDRLPITLA
jgi:hypothetical protein